MVILHGLLAFESYLKQVSLASTMLKPKMAASKKHSGCCSHPAAVSHRKGGVSIDLALMKSLADPDKVHLPQY